MATAKPRGTYSKQSASDNRSTRAAQMAADIKSGKVKIQSGQVFNGAKLGAAVVKKAVEKAALKAGEKPATKIGQKVGQKIAESKKPSKYPSAEGKKMNIAVKGDAKVTGKSGSKSVSKNVKKIEVTKKPPSEKQRLGSYNAQETKRVKAITGGASDAKSASQKIVGKEVIKKRGAQAVAALAIADDLRLRSKKK